MIKENREHRSHELNPRKHAMGPQSYNSPSTERVWTGLRPHALLSEPEMKLINDIPRMLGPGNYANLGHAKGGSAVLLSRGLSEYDLKGNVYSIDIRFVKGCDALIENFKANHVIKCKGNTQQWANKLAALRFNFVFIDADHCYEAVVADFNSWAPLVGVGGLVSFHDTNQDFSHNAIVKVLDGSDEWAERGSLHVHRIRTFQRVRRITAC